MSNTPIGSPFYGCALIILVVNLIILLYFLDTKPRDFKLISIRICFLTIDLDSSPSIFYMRISYT